MASSRRSPSGPISSIRRSEFSSDDSNSYGRGSRTGAGTASRRGSLTARETDALFPVEAQATLGIHAGQRTDRCGDAHVLAAVLGVDFGEVQALMALAALDHQVEADQVRIVDAQLLLRRDVRADFFEGLHRRLPWLAPMLTCPAHDASPCCKTRTPGDPPRRGGDPARPRCQLRRNRRNERACLAVRRMVGRVLSATPVLKQNCRGTAFCAPMAVSPSRRAAAGFANSARA